MKEKWFRERLFEHLPEKILSIVAAVILFLFNQLDTIKERFVSAPIKLITNQKLSPADRIQKRVRVTLRGPENQILTIKEEELQILADFSEYQVDGQYKAPLKVLRRGSALESDEVEILLDPLELTISLEGKDVRNLEITPTFTGQLPRGYEMVQWTLEPTHVVAEGPKSQVVAMNSVLTEPIDLRGRTGNFTSRVRLLIEDERIDFPLGSLVDFQAQIQESVINLSWNNVAISGINLGSEYRLMNELPTVSIEARGPQNLLESLDVRTILVQVDFQFVESPGVYLVSLNPRLPLGIELVSITPPSLEIEVISGD